MSRRQIPLDHIWVVGPIWSQGHRWHLWPEHLRTLTHPSNAPALTEKKQKLVRWATGLHL